MAKERLIRSTLLALAFVAALASLLLTSVLSLEFLRGGQAWSKRNQQVRLAVHEVRATLLDTETAQRGLLLTGDRRFLKRFTDGRLAQDQSVGALDGLLANSAEQRNNLARLRDLMETRLAEQLRTIAAQESGEGERALEIVRANTDKGTADAIKALLEKMDREEARLQDERHDSTKRRAQWALAVMSASSFLLMMLGGVILGMNRDIRRREELQKSLTETLHREKEVRKEAEDAHASALRSEQLQKRRARQASLAADVAIAMTGGSAPRDLLRRCCEAAVQHLDAAFARIWTVSADGETLELQASAGIYTHTDGGHSRVPVGQFKIGMVAAERKPHLTNDVLTDPRVSDPAWARRVGLMSFAGYPLVVEDRLLGVLAMFARHPLTEDTLDTLASISNTVGLGIERKRVEMAIRESERHYRFLADAVPNQVWTALPNGALDYVNQRVCEYSGRTYKQMIGEGWQSLVHPDDLHGCVSRWTESLRSGEPYEVEFRLRRAEDGSYRAHIARALAFRSPSGDILKWFGTNTDISERKQAEEEREQLYQEAQKAIRSRDDLLATVSHDLRSPLATVVMATTFLRRHQPGDDPARVIRHGAAIERAAHQMEHLIRDLLDLAAIEAGHLSVDMKVNDAGRLAADAVELAQPLARAKDIHLVDACHESELMVSCDRDRIAQVFSNLIGNAIKFTPAQGLITVKCERRKDAVLFSISDTGSGIAPGELPRVFDRFWQSKEHAKAGTGLGLAICQGILAQHGSAISVESTLGAGTTFSFSLPAVARPQAGEDVQPTSAPPPPAT